MSNWDSESFDGIINHGYFRITQPGPLHAPIQSFTVRRNEKLELVLETHCSEDAKSTAVEHPSGTVRINTDMVQLTSISGLNARAVGVQPLHVVTSINNETGTRGLREEARILQYIEATIPGAAPAKYTIDWLENLQARDFIFPDSIKDNKQITENRYVGGDGGIHLRSMDEEHSFGRASVGFTAAGIELYLCAARRSSEEGAARRGYIIYVGTPDEDVRRKIRTAISYSLHTYLVYLGNTTYTDDWHTVSFKAVNGYSIGRRVFDLPVLPPAPLGSRFQGEVTSQALSRLVNGLYSQYDDLTFGSLSWAYWHALCATMHIAAAHFGAAIEALQRNYVKAHRKSFRTNLVSERPLWRTFSCEMRRAIIKLEIPEEDKQILLDRVGNLNETPRSVTMKRLLIGIDVELGEDEQRAWKRRNDAAHGNEVRPEEQLQVIRDTQLLRGIFDRMLLRIINGSDLYHDYATVGFPIRNLRDPVPPEAIT